jgi:outer membrane receptor for ferrienterochelin and colicin
MRRILLLSVVFIVSLSALLTPARDATGGTIEGRVVDSGGQPLESVAIQILGTPLGALTDHDGRFSIRNVSAGKYEVRALLFGYKTEMRKDVLVGAVRVSLDFSMTQESVGRTKEIEVTADGKLKVDKKESGTKHKMDRTSFDSKPIDTLFDAVTLKPGVTMHADQLNVRGERGNSTQFQVDGIVVPMPLGGRFEPSTNGIATIELATGGFDAEVGDVKGAVINITTPEGGSKFSGSVEYTTDDFGAPDKTFDNFDRLGLAFGGPSGIRDLTYFVAVQGTFQDGYLKTQEQRPRRTILDFIRVGPRQSNELNYQGKIAWKPGPNRKLTLELLSNHRTGDIYSHLFSRNGFVQTRIDTLRGGVIATRYGRFSATREDSTFVPYNAAEHTPDVREDFQTMKAIWTHTIAERTFYTAKLSRVRFDHDMRVANQRPWEYNGEAFQAWTNQIDLKTEPFFATHGDYPRMTERHTTTWIAKGDLTHTMGGHNLKSGVEGRYNDLWLHSVLFPLAVNQDGTFGGFRSLYHYYNPEASVYFQDRWTHEGMVLNAGLRFDMFSVGDQIDLSEVKTRSRNQLSPRLGIAYPVSDRDVFSFHYGRFSQVPDRSSIFENRTGSSQVRGNPDLVNETTVAYQAALQHMFTGEVFGQFAVYFKDIFGLLSVERLSEGNQPGLVNTFVNKDYASARGFEVSIEKRFSHNFGGELSYSYSQATGIASDPNQQVNTRLLYLPISEQPLDWDQRHTVSAQVVLSQPEDWLASVIWTYGSGFPFTPSSRNERTLDPSITNSGRLPSITSLNLQVEKHYMVWDQDVKFFLRGNNLLDTKNIADLEPDNWPNPPSTNNNDYRAFYTETGRTGGAYLGDDVNRDGVEDWIPVNDPRVLQEGRSLRVGLGMKF